MIFDEKDRLAKTYISALRARRLSKKESFEAMLDMNNAMIKLCVSSIKAEKPRISNKELIKEMKKIFLIREFLEER